MSTAPVDPNASPKPSAHAMLGALLRASRVSNEDLLWSTRRFDEQWLNEELQSLLGIDAVPERLAAARELAREWSQGYKLSVARLDDLRLRINGLEVVLPRWLAGEMLGALGSNLLPTQARARRLAIESARECAFFGYGPLHQQVAPDPLELISELLAKKAGGAARAATLFVDLRPTLGCRLSPVDLLRSDSHFHRVIERDEELSRFQVRLREDILDGTMVERLRGYFNKRATAGVRDALRWLLGSRHPWFGWKRARELLIEAFDEQGCESFVAPRLIIYCLDPSCTEEQLRELREHNAKVLTPFAAALAEGQGSIDGRLTQLTLLAIAEAMLDIHHDHPDFDLESAGAAGGQTHASFWSHGVSTVLSGIAGGDPSPRRNFNLAAHFDALGWTKRWLGGFSDVELGAFFENADRVLRSYAKTGLPDARGQKLEYQRLPTVLALFEADTVPALRAPSQTEPPREFVIDGVPAEPSASALTEELVDSFPLSDLSAPQHAHFFKHRPLIDKLVVFFSLIMRHYLETQHVPDLRPARIAKDFLLLGLWGTNTANVTVKVHQSHLPKDNSNTAQSPRVVSTRFEIVYTGRSQVKAYRLALDRQHEAALARLAFSQLGPLLEPSILRALGNFLMAAEENSGGKRAPSLERAAIARQGLEIFREAARTAVKGGLVDTATAVEIMLDSSVDGLQRALDRLVEMESSLSNRLKAGR